MSDVKDVPEVVVYTRDKREILGTLKGCTEISKDINFNAASELSLTVADKDYDDVSETWIKNPLYEKLEENIVLYLNDNTKYFSYPVRTPYTNYAVTSWKVRTGSTMSYDAITSTDSTSKTNNLWKIKSETELFDIGSDSGYTFTGFKRINPDDGSLESLTNSYQTATNGKYMACDTFIPVSAGDVIAFRCYNKEDNGEWQKYFDYRFSFYTDADSSTYIPYYDGNSEDTNDLKSSSYKNQLSGSRSVLRCIIDSTRLGGNDSGYMRVTLICNSGVTYSYSKDSRGWYQHWTFPAYGYIKIYSRERKCSSVYGFYNGSYNSLPCKWFVITDVEENSNGIYNTKTITAKSYEYTLNKRCFSLSANTLALYTPPNIVDYVNSDSWVVDHYGSTYVGGSQHMEQGLLNQVLDELPNWKIGSVSNSLMSTYRTFEDVDNANVYNFLMNDIQSTYQCFIVFDNEEQTISAYTWKDMLDCYDNLTNSSKNQILSWDNAVKELNITNSDSDYVTALQVHTGDDLYSISLVNPTGNNVIYNFDYVKSDMKFTPDYNQYAGQYAGESLSDMLDYWEKAYKACSDSDSITTYENGKKETRQYFKEYREAGKYVIEYTLSITKLETQLAEALAEYRSVADKINVGLEANAALGEDDYTSYKLTDKPLKVTAITSRKNTVGTGAFYTKDLYSELYSSAQTYWSAFNSLETQRRNLATYQDKMKNIASRLTFKPSKGRDSTLNPSELTNTDDNSVPSNGVIILSEKQLLALDKFIYEGVWTDEGATFSDTYDADDIYNTLVSVYDNAVADLADRLSFPTYEFSITTANIVAIPELAQLVENLTVGSPIYLENPKGGWYKPVLLSVHINYKDDTDFSMSFSTDFKKKPLELRFNSLFGTINQTSTQTSEFTYDD